MPRRGREEGLPERIVHVAWLDERPRAKGAEDERGGRQRPCQVHAKLAQSQMFAGHFVAKVDADQPGTRSVVRHLVNVFEYVHRQCYTEGKRCSHLAISFHLWYILCQCLENFGKIGGWRRTWNCE